MIFLISTIMLVLVLVTKIFFVVVGKGVAPSIFEIVSTILLTSTIAVGIFSYIKNSKTKTKKQHLIKVNILSKVLIVLSVLFVLTSFFININKKDVAWDAVALYDARAKFLASNVNFSQMVELSKYDPLNSYYYVLYPPHTSILHYFWHSSNTFFPVGVMYTIFLVFLGTSVFFLTRRHLGFTAASVLTFLTVSNGVIFSSSLIEYTNLPFTLQMLLGVFLIYEYLKDYQKENSKNVLDWRLIYGIGLTVTAMWIRFLEPVWIGAFLALLTVILYKRKITISLIFPIVAIFYGIIEYISWQNYVSSFGQITKIVNFSISNLTKPIIGIFTGSIISIIVFFVKSWGIILFVHLYAIFLPIIYKERLGFLQIFLFSTILIYFSGLYFVSFQSEWWKYLGDSLVRSSTFMIPISGYVILEYLHDKKNL